MLLWLLIICHFFSWLELWGFTFSSVFWSKCKFFFLTFSSLDKEVRVVFEWVSMSRNWQGFSGGSVIKNSPANAGDTGLILGSGRLHGEGNGNTLQYSCLENPMDRGAWWATVRGVTESDSTEHAHIHIHSFSHPFPLWFITGCWIYILCYLCYTVGSCCLSVLYMIIWSTNLKLSNHPPTLSTANLFSTSVSLFLFCT